MNNKTLDDYWVTEAMIRIGGNFISNLGKLYRSADPNNQKILKNSFYDYWIKYHNIALKNYKEWELE